MRYFILNFTNLRVSNSISVGEHKIIGNPLVASTGEGSALIVN